MIRMITAGLVLLLLSACASLEAQSPAQRVYAAQSDYNGLLVAALAYESQPRCVSEERRLTCSDTRVVAEIRRADLAASAALKAAQDTVRTPGASSSTIALALSGAVNAIGAFRSILVTYRVLKT